MTRSMFDILESPVKQPLRVAHDFAGVPGLTCCSNFLSRIEAKKLLTDIDTMPWLSDLDRRVQHYGYKYDYKARKVDSSMRIGPLPPFAKEVAEGLVDAGLCPSMPDQAIVNEYRPGQGIAFHVDCVPCFGDPVITVSLGDDWQMDFIETETKEERHAILAVGSALCLTSEARYQWAHGIRRRLKDPHKPRSRRVSLTFRNVILG